MLMAKSSTYTKKTAVMIVVNLTAGASGASPNAEKIPAIIARVQASASKLNIVAAVPATMNGFRLPHEMRQLSLRMPTAGCTRAPDSGPAIQTSAMMDLLRPSESRYGCHRPISRASPHRSWLGAYRPVGELHRPSDLEPTTTSISIADAAVGRRKKGQLSPATLASRNSPSETDGQEDQVRHTLRPIKVGELAAAQRSAVVLETGPAILGIGGR